VISGACGSSMYTVVVSFVQYGFFYVYSSGMTSVENLDDVLDEVLNWRRLLGRSLRGFSHGNALATFCKPRLSVDRIPLWRHDASVPQQDTQVEFFSRRLE
jgi:hypothetical protein